MSTIQNTMDDIVLLQDEINRELKKHINKPKVLVDLLNYSSIYYYNFLAHACLDKQKNEKFYKNDILYNKYYTLTQNSFLLEEYIRWINISGLFTVWNIFELFVREKEKKELNQSGFKIEEAYKNILKKKEIEKKLYDKMVSEFNVIRITRNSLHQGGYYNNDKKRIFNFYGEKYIFEKGTSVKPIRIMKILYIIWQHYKIIENIR